MTNVEMKKLQNATLLFASIGIDIEEVEKVILPSIVNGYGEIKIRFLDGRVKVLKLNSGVFESNESKDI